MFRISKSALAVLLVLSFPIAANAWVAKNRLVVTPEGPSTFFVAYRGLSALSDFWCAAGDYVVRELNLPPSTRIYRISPGPRRGGEGIKFSLSPDGATSTGFALAGPRNSLSATHARLFCDMPKFTR